MKQTHIVPQDPMVEFIILTDCMEHPGLQFRIVDLRKLGRVVGLEVRFLFSGPGIYYFSFISLCYGVSRRGQCRIYIGRGGIRAGECI